MARRFLKKGWCPWGERPCPKTCPIDAIDNHGQAYKACPDFRLKTQKEIDAMCGVSPKEGTGT